MDTITYRRDPGSDLHKSLKQIISRVVPSGPLEARVRELCAKVVTANDGELEPAIAELRLALREHNQRLRRLAVAKLANPLSSCKWQPALNTQDKSLRAS